MRAAGFWAALIVAAPLVAQEMGPVTPTAVTYHFTSVSIVEVDGSYRGLMQKPFTYTFRRADPDFAATPLDDVTIPFGRYTGVGICFENHQEVTLDAVRYEGRSGTLFQHGDLVSTTAAGVARAGGTVVESVLSGGPPIQCTSFRFPSPLCIADGPGDCQPGDQIFSASAIDGDAGSATGDLILNLLLDLMHSVFVDADTGALQGMPMLQITVGAPGAGVHLSRNFDGAVADVSVLFGPDRSVLSARVSKWPLSAALNGMCVGQSDVMLRDGAAHDGPTFISRFDPNGGGALQIPATQACNNASECNSVGVNVIRDLLQPVGASATVRCVADAEADPPYLGYVYHGGPGGDRSTVTLEISRIVDPGDLFGICSAETAVARHPGTCAAQNRSTDGYP